jgi:DNA polymerase-3 subunit gamma/tau
VSLALYRKYRPETFAEVIGQEHVTGPLAAGAAQPADQSRLPVQRPARLRQDVQRAHPGPLLNCEQGADARPVRAVRVLRRARSGAAGSIDVIEIDAASHGGVDDARDLRERAFFAPVESRFKIYIIDEAHMVTRQGSTRC